MKGLILIFLASFPLILPAQPIEYSIEGVIINPGKAKFGYLYLRGDRLEKVEIKDGKFNLRGKSDLNGNFYRAESIFLDERGDITFEEVKSKLKERVWTPGLDPFLNSVALEEVELEIEAPDKLSTAKVKRGVLTSQMKENRLATRSKNKIEFIKKHPDSPVSFHTIVDAIPFYELDAKKSQELYGPISDLFDQLSDRLKYSPEGIALKKKIDRMEVTL